MLRNKMMQLESVYNPRIEAGQETIETQRQEIQNLEAKISQANEGNGLLMKILIKHQKMVEVLKAYIRK